MAVSNRAHGHASFDQPWPWRTQHLAVAAICLFLAACSFLVSWYGASGSPRLSQGLGWMDLGAGGLILLAVTSAMWITTGRRSLARRQEQVTEAIGRLCQGSADPLLASSPTGSARPARRQGYVWAVGMTHYHAPGCPLTDHKAVKLSSLAGHRRARRRPCRVCLADEAT